MVVAVSANSETQQLVEQFQKFFDLYESTVAYLGLSDREVEYFEKQKLWTGRLQNAEFPVAFFGAFSAGKSTVINAILHRETLPEDVKSTTAFPTVIRKGDRDRATIYYIDAEAKARLRGQLIAEIKQHLGDAMPGMEQDFDRYLLKLEQAMKAVERETETQIDRQPYKKLEQLLQRWHEFSAPTRSVELSELAQYVEGHGDSLFVDRIEVYVADINIPEDIILVDLPGLGVDNPRHVEFTKNYIRQEAKAFVVCMKPKSLIEGDEARFLAEVNKSNPTILQRSFWLINQWDILNHSEKQKEEANFWEKTKAYRFSLEQERFFKVSALQYSLLQHLAHGTLERSAKRRQELDTLKGLVPDLAQLLHEPDRARALSEQVPAIRDFALFRQQLFAYLQTTAKKEFLANARGELRQAILKLEKLLEPIDRQYREAGDLGEETKLIKVSQERRQFLEQLERIVKDFTQQVSRESNKGVLWSAASQHEIETALDRRLDVDRPELEASLLSGWNNLDGNLSLLPEILAEQLDISGLVMEKFVAAIADFKSKIAKLIEDIRSVNRKYLPEEILDELDDQLSDRDIHMRLNGLADRLFFEFASQLEVIGFSLKDCQGDNLEKRLDLALKKYSDGLKEFLRKFSREIDRSLRSNVKNHAEYIQKQLLHLLADNEDAIAMQILRHLDESEIAAEVQKQKLVTAAYSDLVQLRNHL